MVFGVKLFEHRRVRWKMLLSEKVLDRRCFELKMLLAENVENEYFWMEDASGQRCVWKCFLPGDAFDWRSSYPKMLSTENPNRRSSYPKMLHAWIIGPNFATWVKFRVEDAPIGRIGRRAPRRQTTSIPRVLIHEYSSTSMPRAIRKEIRF